MMKFKSLIIATAALFLGSFSEASAVAPPSDLIITGVYDGPLSGGTPKGVELYVAANITDLSIYGLGSANNGGGTDGQEFTFPAVSATLGDYIYVTNDSLGFYNFFGFSAGYVSSSMGINGDDAIELFLNSKVRDVFGDINVDGTNQPWEYLDSWASRVNGTGPDDSTFVLANWTFGGINHFDGLSTNASATSPLSMGTYSPVGATPGGTVPGYPAYTISQISGVDATGVADSLTVQCELNGTVFSIDFDGNAGYGIYMYDNTGGINVHSFTDKNGYTSPAQGDSLTVFATIGQYNGLTQASVDSIVLRSTGNTLMSPALEYSLDESTEGEYIQLNGFVLVDATQWPTSTGSANVDITNNIDTLIMRIDSDTDIDGTVAPTTAFHVRGAGSQFDNSSPYDGGYQIFPSSLLDIIPVAASSLPVYSIAAITGVDANGVADSLTVEAEINATVISIDFDGNNGYSFYVHDGTGGINAFNFNDAYGYTSPMMGDSLKIFGEVDQYNGLTQFVVDSIFVMATNAAIMAPTVVTTLSEATESELIRLNGMTMITPSQWPTSSGSKNVSIANATDTVTMRIDSDTDIDGTNAPIGMFDVIGVGGQFDNSSPHDEGYQVFPRSLNDILVAAPINPTVNFAITSQSELESIGSVTVNTLINPVSTTAQTIYYTAAIGVGVNIPGDGSISPLPNLTTGVYSIAVPANEDTATFVISIVDDAIMEGNESLFVKIDSVSSGLTIGANTDFTFIVIDNDAPVVGIPTYDIADINADDANGQPDSLNVECKLHGVVVNDDLDGNAGISFHIYDATGGMNIFNFADVSNYVVKRGDSLRVIGTVGFYNGQTQFTVDSIVRLDSNIVLKQPLLTATLGAAQENEFIRMNGMTLVTPSQWPTTQGGSANVTITDGVTNFTMRIDSDTDINGTPAPTGAFDVIGVGGQFDGSTPYTTGYQIFPRDTFDILPIVALTPEVNFASSSQSNLENAGVITVTLNINPTSSSAEQVKVYVNNGSAVAADYSLTPSATADTITLNIAANATSTSYDVAIVDDAIQELDETVTFSIAKTSSGLATGIVGSQVFTIQDNDTPIPTYDIVDITTVDADGIADSVNVYCRAHGVVFSHDFDGNVGLSFYIYDGTGGINVFNFNDVDNYVVAQGDSLRVVGSIEMYNGLTELVVDSIVVLSTGATIQTPPVVIDLDETTDSELIRLNQVTLIDPTQWPTTSGGSVNIDIRNATDTFVLRIDSDMNLNGSPAPVGFFDVIGVGGQFDNSVPHTSGYQILPRDLDDIIIEIPTLAVTEIMPSSNHSSPIGGDWFEITNYGTQSIDLNGFSWDDESAVSGTHTFSSTYPIGAGESIIVFDGLNADVNTWLTTWMQLANGLKVIAKDDFSPIGFSSLSSTGDAVNLYDDNGALIVKAEYQSTDVTAGFSIQFDTIGGLLGSSVNGVDGAYTADNGSPDVGSPGNMNPISLFEFDWNTVSIYPNPATTELFVAQQGTEQVHIELHDVNGKAIAQWFSTDKLTKISVDNMPKGLYLITIEIDGSRKTDKLIVR